MTADAVLTVTSFMVFFSLLEDQVSDMQHLGRWGYFFRAPVKRHVRRPPDEEIARFQKELAELIPQKIEEGYTVAVQDETIVTSSWKCTQNPLHRG